MSLAILSRISCQKYYKVYYPVRNSAKSVCSTQKLCVKRRISMKNKFTFRNEFHHNKIDTLYSESSSISPNLPHEQNESQLEYDEIVQADHYISTDLLSGENVISKPLQAKKNSKPSLVYQGEILFGVHPVYFALLQKRRIFHRLYTRKEIDSSSENDISRKTEIIRLAESMNIPICHVDSRGLKILTHGAVHQGICLDAGFLPLSSWNEDQSKNGITETNPLWLVLDEILDPMNVGGIIRSACYFGVDKLFTIRGNSCKLSPAVSKASSGALEMMNIYQIDNLEDFIKERKDNGWSVVSTVAYSETKSALNEPPINAAEFNVSKPTIMILGNEGRGISEAVLNLCDSLISIEPGKTLPLGMDSLNVSVAAGVLLYVLNSQTKNIKM